MCLNLISRFKHHSARWMQQRVKEITLWDYCYQFVAYNPPESVHMCWAGSAVDFIDTTLCPFILILGVFPLKTLLFCWKETNPVGWISKGLSTSHSIRWAKNVTTWERSHYNRFSHAWAHDLIDLGHSKAHNKEMFRWKIQPRRTSPNWWLVAGRPLSGKQLSFFVFINQMMEWGVSKFD